MKSSEGSLMDAIKLSSRMSPSTLQKMLPQCMSGIMVAFQMKSITSMSTSKSIDQDATCIFFFNILLYVIFGIFNTISNHPMEKLLGKKKCCHRLRSRLRISQFLVHGAIASAKHRALELKGDPPKQMRSRMVKLLKLSISCGVLLFRIFFWD